MAKNNQPQSPIKVKVRQEGEKRELDARETAQAALSTKQAVEGRKLPKYVCINLEAVENHSQECPWGFGTDLSAKLKGYNWAMPAAGSVVRSQDKLVVTLPADAIIEGSLEFNLPEELVAAAEFKATAEGRNFDREAHVMLASFSRRRTLSGGWTAWQLDPPANKQQDVLQQLFEAVDLRPVLCPGEGELPVAPF